MFLAIFEVNAFSILLNPSYWFPVTEFHDIQGINALAAQPSSESPFESCEYYTSHRLTSPTFRGLTQLIGLPEGLKPCVRCLIPNLLIKLQRNGKHSGILLNAGSLQET